jgi:hypothetical protein
MRADVWYTAPICVTVDTDLGEVLRVTVCDEALSGPSSVERQDGRALHGVATRKALEVADESAWPGWTFGW